MTKIKVGNTIKTAGNIYRDRFKEFYFLALINSFWIFVPVYGWAKYSAAMGLLARLAYGEATGNPETIVEARRHIKPKTWLFFGAGLMTTLIFILKSLRMSVVLVILPWIAIKYDIVIFSPYVNAALLLLLYFAISYYYPYWLLSHLFLYELPLATSQTTNMAQSRNISWQLAETKSFLRLIAILFCFASFISLPYFFFQQIYNFESFNIISQQTNNLLKLSRFSLSGFWLSFSSFFHFSLKSFFYTLIMPILSFFAECCFRIILHINIPNPSAVSLLLRFALNLVLFSVFRALLIPFWQLLKAVIYYRLNSSLENT